MAHAGQPSFPHYLGGAVVRPNRTFAQLVDDPRAVRHGFSAMLLIGVLYTLTVAGLAAKNVAAFAPPAIHLPRETYYRYEVFFALLSVVLGWILAAGVVHLLARLLGGTGTFETTLATLSFAFVLPSFVTWVPETVGMVLNLTGVFSMAQWLELSSEPGFWQVFSNAYQLVAVGWMLLLAPIAVAKSERLGWGRAVPAGLLGVVAFMATMLIFIR